MGLLGYIFSSFFNMQSQYLTLSFSLSFELSGFKKVRESFILFLYSGVHLDPFEQDTSEANMKSNVSVFNAKGLLKLR